MLWLDALEQGSPAFWLLLTTSIPEWDGERWRRSLEHVSKAVRRRWPKFEYACLIEFTTGYGPRSGGKRRPHGNLFVRGVPLEEREAFRRVVAAVWCERMVASERQQRVDLVDEDKGGMRGLTRYVGMHFLKESQAPPKGWRGQRFRCSRGYFTESRTVMRERARASLQAGRVLWKAESEAYRRAFSEADRAGYFADSSAGSSFVGMLEGEGYIAAWTEEIAERLRHADEGRSWALVIENRKLLLDGTTVVTGHREVRRRDE